MSWRSEAEDYGLDLETIEVAAEAGYYANYKELPQGRFPPAWDTTSEEVRDFVRAQTVRTIIGYNWGDVRWLNEKFK